MKRIVSTVIATLLTAGFVFASGIENKTNLSTGYIRNPSRNTESERPEAAFYNIAGTGFMKDGLYIEAGNQFVIKEYSNTLNTGTESDYTSKDDSPVFLYPNADIVYKTNNLSIFGTFGIYCGGGSLSYEDGTSATSAALGAQATKYAADAQNAMAAGMATEAAKALAVAGMFANAAAKGGHSLDVTSIGYGGQLGASYKVLDNLSVGVAGRFVYGTQAMEIKSAALKALGTDTVSYDAKATGFGVVAGVQYKLLDMVDLSLQYASITKMEYEVSNAKGGALAEGFGIKDGATFNTDIPSALNFGAGVKVMDPLYVSLSFNYYFNKNAHQDTILGTTDYDNSWEVALGVDYRFSKMVLASLGLNYAKQGYTETSNSAFNPVLDSFCVGAGVEVTPTKMFTCALGGLYVKYFDDTYNKVIDLHKEVINLSLGLTFKLF